MDAHPEEVAIESATATITYSQLRGLLDEQAARLHAKGIGPGDRVGIRVPSGTTDLYVAILSTLWAGAAYVPVWRCSIVQRRRWWMRKPACT